MIEKGKEEMNVQINIYVLIRQRILFFK